MFLLINTTDDKSQVALIKNNKIFVQKVFEANFAHSEKLLPEISKLLNAVTVTKGDSHGKFKELKTIIVITGPGSYTGCRVGVATANALGFSLNIPVVGISKGEIPHTGVAHFSVRKSIKKVLKMVQRKLKNKKTRVALPFYEKPPHITKPKPIL